MPSSSELEKIQKENLTNEQQKETRIREEAYLAGIEVKDRQSNEAEKKVETIEQSIRKWHQPASEVIEDGARKMGSKVVEQNRQKIETVLKELSGRDYIDHERFERFIDTFGYVMKHDLEAMFKWGYLSHGDGDAKDLLDSFWQAVDDSEYERNRYKMRELYDSLLKEGTEMMQEKMKEILASFQDVEELEGAVSRGGNRYIMRDELESLKARLR